MRIRGPLVGTLATGANGPGFQPRIVRTDSDFVVRAFIMLAYLYCAAYTRMTMNESSARCEQRRITFNDDWHRMQLARPELPAPHYILCTGCYQLHPLTVQALLPPTY